MRATIICVVWLLHKMTRDHPDNQEIGFDVGTTKQFYEVATLIDQGHHVFVMLFDEPGSYKVADKVRIKAGHQEEYLESIDENGNATTSLFELPAWTEEA